MKTEIVINKRTNTYIKTTVVNDETFIVMGTLKPFKAKGLMK